MSKKALMMMSSALAFPLSGASIDLWFASNLIYPSGGFTDYLSCSRASIGYAKNADGTLTQFASNELRIGVGTGTAGGGCADECLYRVTNPIQLVG